MTMPVALPFGARDLKISPYADALGTVLGTQSYDLPNLQTLTWSETEDFESLRGDDREVAQHGNGARVDWSVDSGGLSLICWSILSGGTIISKGLTPNRQEIMRKKGSDTRPYVRIDGQAISESGGDTWARLYRCKCNDTLDGEFSDGQFMSSGFSGVGLPLLDEGNDLLYDIIRNEQITSASLTPLPNPVPVPRNLTAGTKTGTSPSITQVITWTAVDSATSYVTQKSTNGGTSYAATTVQPAGVATTITETGLSTGTILFRVAAIVGGVQSEWSPSISVVV
jgi:hypothetical protein